MRAALARGDRAHRLHQQRRHPARSGRRPHPSTRPRRLDEGEGVGAYKRGKVLAERLVERLVADQGLPAVISQPKHADRAARHQANPHGARRRRSGQRTHPRLRGHRAKSGPCRRRRARSRAGDGKRRDRRAIHPGWAERFVARVAGGHRRADGASRAHPESPASCPSTRWPGRPRAIGHTDRQGAVRHARRPQDGLAPHVLHLGQGGKASLGYSARPYRRGARRRPRMVPPSGADKHDAGLADRVGRRSRHGSTCCSRAGCSGWRANATTCDQPAAVPAPWPTVVAVVAGAQRGRRDRRKRSAACWPGLCRATSVSCWWMTTAATAPREAARALDHDGRLTVVAGAPLPSGWTGKLWAMRQGVEVASQFQPKYLLLTDADIVPFSRKPALPRAARRGRRPRAHLPDGQADGGKLGRAAADPGLRILLRHALPVRLGERRRAAGRPPPPGAACWREATPCGRPAESSRSPPRSSTTAPLARG